LYQRLGREGIETPIDPASGQGIPWNPETGLSGRPTVSFSAWFASLSPFVKILCALGIAAGSFAVGASLVVSTFRAWKLLAEVLSRREKDGNKKE
jgi:hypothetical protein